MSTAALLVADDDPTTRSLVATLARERIEALEVIEAADGAEAIQLGLQRRPQLALLDAELPTLNGVDVALTLRGLRPDLCLALHSASPHAFSDRAREHSLPLFDDLERALAWLELHVQVPAGIADPSFVCARCGYGIARETPPERCPMCQDEGVWLARSWRSSVAIA